MAARSGAWKRSQGVPYSGAGVWGTGIHPVHAVYGEGAPVRQGGRDERLHTAPFEGRSDSTTDRELWGYTDDDSSFVGVDYDERPNWGEQPEGHRANTELQPPWNVPGAVNERFRATRDGAYRTFRGQQPSTGYIVPTETVSEGWKNKIAGEVSVAKPADVSQLERQTSMQQRFRTRNNGHSVDRGTDEPRAGIASRVMGKVVKVYSGGERHYDMFPRQQDTILRPFWYRTAGTGNPNEMIPNAQMHQVPIQRTPPPDPALGQQEISQDYGYTAEDNFYA
jgi:hypothetical protein